MKKKFIVMTKQLKPYDRNQNNTGYVGVPLPLTSQAMEILQALKIDGKDQMIIAVSSNFTKSWPKLKFENR